MRLTPLIAITNQSTVLSNDVVTNAVPAFQSAVHYDFRPYWDTPATLQFFPDPSTIPSGAWQMAILDDSDQAGALGYHDFTVDGYPLAKVFAKTDQQYGYNWTVTLTHELWEMLADPYINLAAQTDNTTFYGYEMGDPVEADALGYTRVGKDGKTHITISDFITPAWFQVGTHQPVDFKHHLTGPLQIAPGGYASVFVSGQGWKQLQQKGSEAVVIDHEEFRQYSRSEPARNPRFRDRSEKDKF